MAAKGKITPYNLDSFSPAATGVPGQNKSGQIIGQGLQDLGKALQQRQDTSDTLGAMAKFGDFQLDYANKKLELQKTYRDKPGDYPAAVKVEFDKLADQYSKDMPNGVRQKFRQLTASTSAQDSDNLVTWAAGRDNEIQVGNIITVKQNLALEGQTVTSVEGLRGVLAKFDAASGVAQKFISAKSDEELTGRYKKLTVENAMASQIYAQPAKVFRDLEGGAYKGVLSPDEITDYSSKARTAIHNRAEDDFYRSMYAAQGEIYDLQQSVDQGAITPAELITRRQAAEANKNQVDANGNRVFPESYLRALDNLIAQVLHTGMTLPPEQAEQRKGVLANFDATWDKYLMEKKTEGKQPNAEDVVFELGVYADLSDLYNKGLIDKTDFDAKVNVMQTRLSLRVGKTPVVKSFSQALEEAGKDRWFRESSNDVFVYGYRYIKEHIDRAYASLDPTSKQELKAQMLAQYTQQVQNLPEGQLKGLKTAVAKRAFAHDLVIGKGQVDGKAIPGVLPKFTVYHDPVSQRVLFVGDKIIQGGATKIFAGVNPESGQPVWRYEPGQIITNSRGQRAKVLADGTFEVIDNGR